MWRRHCLKTLPNKPTKIAAGPAGANPNCSIHRFKQTTHVIDSQAICRREMLDLSRTHLIGRIIAVQSIFRPDPEATSRIFQQTPYMSINRVMTLPPIIQTIEAICVPKPETSPSVLEEENGVR